MPSRKHTTPTQLDLSFGPAEEWRPVVGYEGYYEVSNLGRVRSLTRQVYSKNPGSHLRTVYGQILHPGRGEYWIVGLSKKGKRKSIGVHVLVLEAFVGKKPDGFVANHIDLDKYNNVPSNLEWVTYQRNMHHAMEYGARHRGEQLYNAKLTEGQVREIRLLAEDGMFQRDIARHFGVAQSNIQLIVCRKAWKHVT